MGTGGQPRTLGAEQGQREPSRLGSNQMYGILNRPTVPREGAWRISRAPAALHGSERASPCCRPGCYLGVCGTAERASHRRSRRSPHASSSTWRRRWKGDCPPVEDQPAGGDFFSSHDDIPSLHFFLLLSTSTSFLPFLSLLFDCISIFYIGFRFAVRCAFWSESTTQLLLTITIHQLL